MLKELKVLGVIEPHATAVFTSLNLQNLIGFGVWKWFPSTSSDDESGTTSSLSSQRKKKAKMVQFYGEFVHIDETGHQVQVAYLQQPLEWFTVEKLMQVRA